MSVNRSAQISLVEEAERQKGGWAPRVPYVRPTMDEIRATPWNGLIAVGSFSGCGGSSLGLQMAGWRVPYVIEFVEEAADTYAANFPSTFVDRRDIREVQPEEILARVGLARGELDLLEGSPPCSSFSTAGIRERGWQSAKKYSDTVQRTDDLFWEWARLLDGLRPRAFIAENVPGLTTGAALEEYAYQITRLLADHGYRVAVSQLNSANYGVPQDRRRLIFLGFRRDLNLTPRFPEPTTPDSFTVAEALASVDPSEPDHADFLAESSMVGKAVGRTWEWKRGLRRIDVCARCSETLRSHQRRTVVIEKGRGARRTREVIICADGERGVEVKDYFLLTVPELNRPCPTLTATGSQVGAASVTHPTECRKFTPAEAKALCGFPADFVLTGSREQRYERMGRAVTPPLYAAVGRMIAKTLLRSSR